MSDTHTVTIKTDVPDRLLGEMQALVQAGWFHDMNDLVLEALRRLLDTHRPELMERFIRKDIEWGLGGKE
jgi:Arc/MetJ-type ribon-helix-helix transcriptional regulator